MAVIPLFLGVMTTANFLRRALLVWAALCVVPGWSGAAEALPKLDLRPLWPSLVVERPVWLGEAPDGSGRMFLAEQPGTILILPKNRQGLETNARSVFLDLTFRQPYRDNEEGLLGVAFHPRYRTNGKFYVYYTQHDPRRNVLSEFVVSKKDPARADFYSERILLEVARPYGNHCGGCTIFGPDGYLYVSLGDGGGADDPHDNGQNLQSLLGKIIRLDVDAQTGRQPYRIPPDNPFLGRGVAARGEIWAYGLRNPWRMSFDRRTGQLWAADLGQNKWEEVNIITKSGNYGWNRREGFHPFKESAPAGANFIDPVIEYPHNPAFDKNTTHSPGLSITGGYVYRGKKLPALRGAYLYADFALGTIWGLRQEKGRITQSGALYVPPPGTAPRNVASFAEDARGEIYVLTFEGRTNGVVCELVPAAR